MVVTTIYVVRHGFRGSWTQDPTTGHTSSNVPSPTNIPADPALVSYGVQQAQQLASKLIMVKPKITRVYSSPFYRCLQTVKPFIDRLGGELAIHGDRGLGEWYGTAPFDHPTPAKPELLKTSFPTYRETNSVIPNVTGETLKQLHDRCARVMTDIVLEADHDSDQPEAILICTHAATMIAIGRALTGNLPEDLNTEDFMTYTCGVSKFVRKPELEQQRAVIEVDIQYPALVIGSWECVMNGDCSHLENGAERGWHFFGEESFMEASESDAHAVPIETTTLQGITHAQGQVQAMHQSKKKSKL